MLSIVVTWSLEDAIQTADSMKGRGYGLSGRTAFSLYRLDDRDRGLLLWLAFCGLYVAAGWISGGLAWRYYPTVQGVLTGAFPLSVQAVYLTLCLTPSVLALHEAQVWRSERGGGAS